MILQKICVVCNKHAEATITLQTLPPVPMFDTILPTPLAFLANMGPTARNEASEGDQHSPYVPNRAPMSFAFISLQAQVKVRVPSEPPTKTPTSSRRIRAPSAAFGDRAKGSA